MESQVDYKRIHDYGKFIWMSDLKKILAEWGINAIALAAGMVGSVLIITLSDKPMTFRFAMAQIVCGIAFSGYGTTVVVDIFHLTAPGWIGLIGLALGLLGMHVAKGLIRIGKRFEKNPIDTINDLRHLKNSESNVDNNQSGS